MKKKTLNPIKFSSPEQAKVYEEAFERYEKLTERLPKLLPKECLGRCVRHKPNSQLEKQLAEVIERKLAAIRKVVKNKPNWSLI